MELKTSKHPTFAGLRFDGPSMDEIMKLSKGLPNRTSKGELHVTLIYSKTPISLTARGKLTPPIVAKPKKYSIFTTDEGANCLVLELNSTPIIKRHNEIMRTTGASYDFDSYHPHVTLSYDVGEKFDVDSLPSIDTIPDLICHQEYAQKLNLNWKKKAA